MEKTILITISRGGTARNLLQTDTYKKLKESGNKLVILTPAYQDKRFLTEFSAPNVFFENLIEPKWTILDRLLVGLHMALIYNHSIELWDKHGIFTGKEGSRSRYIIKKIIFLPLSKIRVLRNLVKWVDRVLVKDKYYEETFDKYKPDLVFSTSLIEDMDVFVLKQAQERKISTIGMAKSWDNTSKMSFRVKVDKLIVWSQYVKSESLKFQGYKEKDIIVCGIPQFDFYLQDELRMGREEFFSLIGADPNKKLIFFGSAGGKACPNDGEVVEIISKAISNNEIKYNCQVFVRPHFIYSNDEKRFDYLKDDKNIVLDKDYDCSAVFRDKSDYSDKQIKRLVNILYHSDILITTGSTLNLDAAAFDKPTININFDGYKERPLRESVRKWYLSEYLRAVIKQDGSVLVSNREELVDAINGYFNNPAIKSEGRERLRNRFCHKLDGKSGERIAEVVLDGL
ncbi:CDP-glycerol glycerophosphotransferase family protein [Patescibacteria group bacterium]|nr:CDP-glycerol glycerophosphotransferase family protein [Patescibacteria group bacterium]